MKKYIYILLCLLCSLDVFSQRMQDSVLVLTLDKAIEIARVNSPLAASARHSFRSQYWTYCFYKANYLPSLNFGTSPDFNHRINAITLPDGTSRYVQQNQLTTDAYLSLRQNIALTGGTLSLQTSISRLDMLDNKSYSYRTSPVTIAYNQSIFGYNSLKWDRKIEPVKFEEAKKSYVEDMESVSKNAVIMFFNLARAQTNLKIATFNYAQADTLYTFAKGRYNIGTVPESEMLQFEIRRLSEEMDMLNAQVTVDNYMQVFRSFLGINEAVDIVVEVKGEVPQFSVDINLALELALNNSPKIFGMKLRLLENESSVAKAKGASGLQADIFALFGLSQTANELSDVYKNPLNQQSVQVGISFPILDWGRRKGQVRVAQSRLDMNRIQVEQERSTFEQNIQKTVKQFNLQEGNVTIAAKRDQIAERRSEVARKLYLLGESTILDLNASISEKDSAKRNYIEALYNYWSLYYNLRILTLYDFEKDIPLTEDYESLIK